VSSNFRPGLRPGVLIEVLDALQGVAWRGKIKSVDNAIEGVRLSSRMTVERIEV
jgi:hypothetical protein